MKRLKIILQQNKILILFFLIISIYSFIYINIFKPKELNDNTIYGYVYSYKIDDNKITLKVKSDKRVLVNYYNTNLNIEYGDYVYIYGNYTEISNPTVFNLFNYKKYLYSNKIYYSFNANIIKVDKKSNNIIFKIKNYMVKRIENCKYSKKYLYVFLLSNKDYLEDSLYDSYKNLGLMHLICISGMHISYIILLLKRITKKNKIFIYIFLILYIFILNFSISLLRCFLLYLFKDIRDKHNIKLSDLKLLLIILFILLLINPFYIYNIAFIFSFTISFGIIISKEYINNSIKLSFISFLYSIPIIINNYFKINFISVFINIIFIPFISYIIFPFSCLVFVFNFLDRYLYYLTNIMDKILLKIDNIKLFTLSFSKQNIILIITYYLLLILFIKNRKYIIGIISIIGIFYISGYYFIIPKVYYIDVSQGDSSLIRIYNKNILIDTGGNYNYDLGKNTIIPFLNSIGVKKINYLIISHGDFDHMGESISIVNNYKIDKVIFNCGPYNDLEKELINVLDKKKISYYSCIKELNIDNNKLYFLQTKEYDNENDNSNVIYTKINNYKFLFMGDASYKVEKEIINKYNINNIDVLKVGHHGSKTSSSSEFINEINPKYSIISVGKNNRYGHPNKEVLDHLNDSKVYRTDINGSIMFKLNNNLIIKTIY